jgi:phosphatidylinositol alpha-mannosyltransferase
MQARTLPNTVTIGTFHAYHEKPNLLYKYGRPIFGEFFTRLNSLIAVSKAAYRFAYQMFPGDYHIIPNGVDLGRFGKPIGATARPDRSDHPKESTILFVGRLDKRKGFSTLLETLLEAFVKIKPDYPRLQLQVIGPFEPQDCYGYQKIAQAQGVTDIEFVGYVSPERLPGFYHKADIFCAPSLGFESFGIVLLEAMASGLPIVASNIAGYRTLMTHGQEGLLVSPGEVDPLTTALRHLLDRPRQRCEMGRRGRLKANQYDWDFIVERTLEVYVKTIQRTSETQPKFFPGPRINNPYGHIQRRQVHHVE